MGNALCQGYGIATAETQQIVVGEIVRMTFRYWL